MTPRQRPSRPGSGVGAPAEDLSVFRRRSESVKGPADVSVPSPRQCQAPIPLAPKGQRTCTPSLAALIQRSQIPKSDRNRTPGKASTPSRTSTTAKT